MAVFPVHRRTQMGGRDPHESHRAATPLELLFDLTFVVAFGIAADELARFVAEGHVGAGLAGFVFATFAISWAWINFTWFASAYDTDDWVFRLATMLQMVGVLVLAWTSAEPGAAYVIQPGVGTVPYRFKGVPSAKTEAGETAVVPEALRPPSMR